MRASAKASLALEEGRRYLLPRQLQPLDSGWAGTMAVGKSLW